MSLTEASTPALQTPQTETDPTDSGCQTKSTVSAITYRPRRLRRTETLRRMVRENILRVEDLIYPLFVMTGEGQREEIPSMPGCYRYTLDLLLDEVKQADELGIGAIARGVSVSIHRTAFIVLLSLVVGISIKAIGVLLVSAFVVVPACAARLLSRTFTNYVVLSAGLGVLSAMVGMLISAGFNLPSGPSIVATQLAIFLTAILLPQLSYHLQK